MKGVLLSVVFLCLSGVAEERQKTTGDRLTLKGRVVDSGDRPIVGARLRVVEAYRWEGGAFQPISAEASSTVSDGEGQVTFQGLPEEALLKVRFEHPEFCQFWFNFTTSRDVEQVKKHFRPELLSDGFTKRMARQREVRVRLLSSDGERPLAGVLLEALFATYSSYQRQGFEACAAARSDAAGYARLRVPEGDYELRLGNDKPVDGIGLNETKIHVLGQDREQTFLRMARRGTDVTFTVLEIETKKPVARVSFWREDEAGEEWFDIFRTDAIGVHKDRVTEEEARRTPYVTDERGEYHCQCRRSVWTYHLHHLPAGYEGVDPKGVEIRIPEGGEVRRTFYVRRVVGKK